MKKTLYEQVPVTEELPEKDGDYFVLDSNFSRRNKHEPDVYHFTALTGEWHQDQDGRHPQVWLRPVTVTLPQEVSDEAIKQFADLQSYDDSDEYRSCVSGAIHVKNLLLPYLATLQGRIEELEAGIETLVQMVNKSQEPGHLFFVIDKLREIHKSLTSKPKP